MARQRRSFSEEFKREAVRLLDQSGASKLLSQGIWAFQGVCWLAGTEKKAVNRLLLRYLMQCRQRNTSACAASSQRSRRSEIY